ncbi:MAG: hypothetical protein J6D29_06810 [Solobacterium sp.]|nr:hypothetical protein [Solobacterium sp.]
MERSTEGDFYRNLPEQTVDVLALGSSHMQYAFNPAILYTETGYYSYVLGSSCQPLSMSASMLEEALKTQSPEVVVVDVFTLLPQSDVCYADGMYYKAIDEMSGCTRLEAADYVPNKEVGLTYKFDLLMNHDQWKNIDLKDIPTLIEKMKPVKGYNTDLGYVREEPTEPRYAPLITYQRTQKLELSDDEKDQIDRLIALCDGNKIHLMFIKTPYIIDQENTNKLHAVWDYLKTKNIEYIDYIEKAEELEWFIDMDGDTWHNNSWGAEIITGDLAKRIKEKGYVKNHKENTVYEDLLKATQRIAANSLMSSKNVNIYRLMEEGTKYPCTILLKYKGMNRTSIQEYENNALQKLGFTHDFIEDKHVDYYAIVRNGKLIQESNEPFEANIENLHIKLDEEGIQLNGHAYCEPGEMEIYFLADDLLWVNAVPIDYASRWFWKNGCDGFDCDLSKE